MLHSGIGNIHNIRDPQKQETKERKGKAVVLLEAYFIEDDEAADLETNFESITFEVAVEINGRNELSKEICEDPTGGRDIALENNAKSNDLDNGGLKKL
ncbi:hypothetical protein DSL72_005304 [Monilinia vaccinii-corymbosi]|uniref:Uncharacterized protein n=1 Tax=Monilinia vaccinii-corymbosi TaxID=61207 RepID=A0A8A3PF99_9HELO|nr:hypothetical protein DSL72_005304 [Monilinia vaccinii-corymbosi]